MSAWELQHAVLKDAKTICSLTNFTPCLHGYLPCLTGYHFNQVVPIYGRGGVQEDPRGKHKPGVRTQQTESLQPVPRRPAGQRPAPTSVSCSTALQYISNFVLLRC